MPQDTPRGISYPLYTDPISSTQTAFQDMATDMDTLVDQLSDRLAAAYSRPAAKISGLANQAIAPTTNVVVTFSAEDFDQGGMANIAVNNTRIQLLEKGIYAVGASLAFTATAGTWGVQATFGLTAGIGGGTMSLRGSSTTLDPSPTNTYINPLMMVYADGITTVDVTLTVRTNAAGSVNLQDRNMWAAKVSNLTGGF